MSVEAGSTVLQRLLLGHQDALRAELERVRAGIPHPGLKGDASEEQWRTMLDRHLPRRYRVCTGQVVDSRGGCSEQIDVIVHDAHYCPLFLEKGGSCFVPAESVHAVFEVKQKLTGQYVREAGDKAASVRQLHRTSAPITDRGVGKAAREIPAILGGVVALTATWADGLGEGFRAALADLDAEQRLDLGCVLKVGAFELEATTSDLVIYAADAALVTFFLRLLHRLQLVGTVPAIEWASYVQAVLVESSDRRVVSGASPGDRRAAPR